MFSEITANAVIVLPTKVTPAFTLEHRASVQGTKVRISEHNTKQNAKILLLLKQKSWFFVAKRKK